MRTRPMLAATDRRHFAVRGVSHAQTAAPVTVALAVVTATRIASDPPSLPMAISIVDTEAISEAQSQVSVSESLQRVPGVNAQNRNNYAQHVQLSVSGFGTRCALA